MPRMIANSTTRTAVNIDRCLLVKVEGSGSNVNVNAYETATSGAMLLFGPDTLANCIQWIRNNLPDVISGL